MRKILGAKQEPAEKGIFKWVVGILLLGGIIGGCFLIYRWWTKPTPEQIKQNEEHKKILNKQIEEIKEAINKNKTNLEKAKKGEKYGWETIDEFTKSPLFDPSNKELAELEKVRNQLIGRWNEILGEFKKWDDEDKKQNKSLWERQTNGRWKMLTESLDKDPAVNARFDKFIRSFYQKFAEKKGIKIHEPRIDFRGFGHFYISEEDLISGRSEMGRTHSPEKEGVTLSGYAGEPKKISNYIMVIDLNQVYLLNNGKIDMDKFYVGDPTIKGSKILPIGFDELTETIAHEIAHALQNVMNIDNYKINKTGHVVCSQCESSGERDANENLLYPEWAAEHTKLTTEIKQMIESSSEYQEFKKWWQGSA